MEIAIILFIIEAISLPVKHFLPSYAKYLPAINTLIGAISSLILGTDVLTGISTAGVTCAGYDFVHGILKDLKKK